MRTVTYCTNSTITEAWGVVLGLPGELDEEEVGALAYVGRKRCGPFERVPSVVLVQRPTAGPVPPFWQQQLAWENGHLLARLGHRYLSVHFLTKGDRRYLTYETSLQPAIISWLETYDETLLGPREHYPLDRIGFGYANTFYFPAAGFDLSKYFRVSMGIGVQTANKGLLALETNFRLFDTLRSTDVIVNLAVNAGGDDGLQLQVQTKIVAERRSVAEGSLKDQASILAELVRAKEAAKAMFFDLATDETHRLMGAQYAPD